MSSLFLLATTFVVCSVLCSAEQQQQRQHAAPLGRSIVPPQPHQLLSDEDGMQYAGSSQLQFALSRRRRLEKRKGRKAWTSMGLGGYEYDCTAAPISDPCENVWGYSLVPLPPDCRQYMLCDDRRLASMFSCAAGTAFDRHVERCVSEGLADCPCREDDSKKNSGAGPAATREESRTTADDASVAAIEIRPRASIRPQTSWIRAGDGAFDCSVAPTADPCETLDGYNLLPLPPVCRQYMLCDDRKLTMMFSCAEGAAFDHLFKRCVREDLAICPCDPYSDSDASAAAAQTLSYDSPSGISSDGNAVHASDSSVAASQTLSYGVGKGSTGVTEDGVTYSYVTSRAYKSRDPKTNKVVHVSSSKSAKLSKSESGKGSSKSGKVLSSKSESGDSSSKSGKSKGIFPKSSKSAKSAKDSKAQIADADIPIGEPSIVVPITPPPTKQATDEPTETITSAPTTAPPTKTPNPSDAPVTSRPTPTLEACPKAYDVSVQYEEDDKVSMANPSNPDVTVVFFCKPTSPDTTCRDIWGDGWILFGVCDPSNLPTESPSGRPNPPPTTNSPSDQPSISPATNSPSGQPSISPATDGPSDRPVVPAPGGCPPSYDAAREYAEGDIVSAPARDSDAFNAYECAPGDGFPSCNDGTLNQAWTLLGVCHGGSAPATTTPPSSPQETPVPNPSILPSEGAGESSACISGSGYEDFEGGVFPEPPWSTRGDGAWTIDEGDTYEGSYSIRSPDLSGASSFPAVSSATMSTCETFVGGIMTLGVKASVLPPSDVFAILIDGVQEIQMIDVNEWREVTVDLPAGRHVIDFSYQYNVFNVVPLPPSPPNREGVVYIDDIKIDEAPPRATPNKTMYLEGVLSWGTKPTSGATVPAHDSFVSFYLGLFSTCSLLVLVASRW